MEINDVPEKFLKQVADYYIDSQQDMSRLVLVFPNRRSALFLRKYMHERMTAPGFMPRMVSVTYFPQLFLPMGQADETEMTFILYNVYCDVLKAHGKGDQVPDFDNFYFWSQVLLHDFNDIDSYMVDTKQIFKNIKAETEISANYLTPEQVEVAHMLWGPDPSIAVREEFWNHLNTSTDDDTAAGKFLNLWEIMGEIYDNFVGELDRRNITYTGLHTRRVAEKVKSLGLDEFKGYTYGFVGFSVLPTSRICIFRRLKELGIAQFFWDISSPVLNPEQGTPHPAAKTVLSLARQFPMLQDFTPESIDRMPDIEIISVPTNVGQVKVAADIIENWASQWDEEDKPIDQCLLDTSVVLADESLLMPMLFSVPDNIDKVNVTMGIPFVHTPFAALLRSVITLQRSVYMSHGAPHYFYQHVVQVLSHPHMSLIANDDATAIKKQIFDDHIYNVSADELVAGYPALAFIFKPISDENDASSVKNYVNELMSTLLDRLKNMLPTNTSSTKFYEIKVLEGFALHIDRIISLAEDHGIAMRNHTFLQMLENTLFHTKLAFTGEPLKGLQVMSLDQTRSLDFDNLIVLSANERVFPRRNYNPSLIPANLRAAYLMPTQSDDEASNAYHFFRLISRASRVKLLYDSRTAGLSSGEMSRYLAQLVHFHADSVKVSTAVLGAKTKIADPIVIEKTPEVLDELKTFYPGGKRKLSASAIKTYLGCPLRFYIEYVKGLRISDQPMEYIDAASYGSVLHEVLRDLYTNYEGQTVNEYTIRKIKSDNIEQRVLIKLDKLYYKERYAKRLDQMPSEGKITAKLIAKYIEKMLTHEEKYPPFAIVKTEMGEKERFVWNVGGRDLNFTMSIDRVDFVGNPEDTENSYYRFIDYKTGGDKITTSAVESLFESHDLGGYLQLLIYCHAFADNNGYRGCIQPMIYKMQEISGGIVPLKFQKKVLADYRTLDEYGFMEEFESLIERIFGEDHPFAQTDDLDNCRFCPLSAMCGRYIDAQF